MNKLTRDQIDKEIPGHDWLITIPPKFTSDGCVKTEVRVIVRKINNEGDIEVIHE